MEQDNVGTIVPGEEIPDGALPDTGANTETQSDTGPSEIETRARAMGWRPAEEFNGDPSKWRSAEEFVAKGENDLPVLRENLRRTTDQLTQLQSRLAKQDQEFKSTISRIEKMSDTALQRQREQLDETWSNAMRNAAANGDIERYQQLETGKAQAISNFDQRLSEVRQPVVAEPVADKPDPTADPKYQTTVQSWAKRNPWFQTDAEMNAVAVHYSNQIAAQKPGITLDENLRDTEAYMRRRYADKFGSPSSDPPAVEGGGSRMSATPGRGKGWNEIPADAKAQGAKFIKDGLFKDQNDYAKEYWSQ
jgi:hypothetical protein